MKRTAGKPYVPPPPPKGRARNAPGYVVEKPEEEDRRVVWIDGSLLADAAQITETKEARS